MLYHPFFKQAAKEVKSFFNAINDIAGFDMNCEEFTEFCKEAWKETCSCLQNTGVHDEEKNCIFNECKEHHRVFKTVTDLS